MTIQEIIDATRYRLNNYEKPYLWLDAELVILYNQAMNRFIRETLAIKDSTTASICEFSTTASTANYTLSPLIIFIQSARLATEELLTLDVKPAQRWVIGDTLTGALSTKTCKVVEVLTDYTYVIDHRTGAFTLGESISNGTYAADQGTTYPLLSDYKTKMLTKRTVLEMDNYLRWQTSDTAEPSYFMQDSLSGNITLYQKPDDIYRVKLNVFRYPVTALSTTLLSAAPTTVPELPEEYHGDIVNGICAQAYLKRGEDTYDQKMATDCEALFKRAIANAKVANNKVRGAVEIAAPHNAFI